jgi:phosphoesterase RecJ-like protein
MFLEKAPMTEALLRQVGQRLSESSSILVVSHIRPDGDAIGSLLGLGLALQENGKHVQMVLEDGIPSAFKHLEGSRQVQRSVKDEFDLVCVVDCSDLQRTGKVIPPDRAPDINLDHHATNLNFARVNVVFPHAVATTEIVADLLEVMDWNFSESVSSALLTGLITDTIGFRTSNITPKSMRLAATLMEHGAELSALYQEALVNRSFEAAQLWGIGLSKLSKDGRIVWTSLTQNDRQQVKYPGRDDADLINILSSIDGFDVALIFVEQPNGNVKVSWRSKPTCDVSGIALEFGGGGHPRASGAEIPGSLQEVQQKVLETTSRWIETSVETENS